MGLKLKIPKHYYRWQPEISLSMIYWSLTFGVFFLSIIAALENAGINLLSIVIFIFFIVLFLTGLQRYFIVGSKGIYIHSVLKRHTRQIPYEQIESIAVGAKGIAIMTTNMQEPTLSLSFLMLKNTQASFVADVLSQPLFCGTILAPQQAVKGQNPSSKKIEMIDEKGYNMNGLDKSKKNLK